MALYRATLSPRLVIFVIVFAAAILVLGFVAARQTGATSSKAPLNPSRMEVSVCTWQGCKSGALSYSQDDGLTTCRAPLEAAGFRGTFYYSGTRTLPWFANFSNAGHEVGSHLVNHTLNCTTPPSCFPNCTPQSLAQTPYTQADVTNFRQNQIEPNITAIEAGTGKPVVSMSYPCGATDAGRMVASAYYFVGARGYYDSWDSNLPWTYNINPSTPGELMNLNADVNFSATLVDRAIREGGWEIATMHDACLGIDYIRSRRDGLWVAPVGDVLKYIRVRNAAQFSNFRRTGQTITFDAVHNLGNLQRQKVNGAMMSPIVYDNPVTLRVHVLVTDTVSNIQVNGAPVSFTVQRIGGIRYAVFDTPLNFVRHVTVTVSEGIPAYSMWNDTTVPANNAVHDPNPIELGVKFRAEVDGHIIALRFYKGITNTGTHVGHLWTVSGTRLAGVTFTQETAAGWQTVALPSPVPIVSNTIYVASYHTNAGNYALTRSYFTAGYSNAPLYALGNSEVSGGNGVYRYGPSAFPNQTSDASNYWVDVVFKPAVIIPEPKYPEIFLPIIVQRMD